ncbi:monocarboxylate transporter 14-like [Strongylocentrotus purpuratus]|uniref:Major facilitator superfamily (MFS) profile domain-containing protein n=1 Tax=Strongylocentrotus purpuratus TaxID=7668 RepID=A0A7M7NRV5_STRPU|nr:monocarboxylate transporter 14-like [Strongylocentrotus purpuratus]
MSGSIEYQPPVSSRAHQSLRQWIRNRWGCVVVVATVLFNFVLNGLLFNYNLLFVAFQEEFESSATLTGWVGALPLGISLMIAPFVKLASERFGYRLVAISGVVSTSTGVFMTSFLSSLIPMFATFGVMAGIGAGLFTVCAFDLIVLYFPERNTMRAVAIASTGSTTAVE